MSYMRGGYPLKWFITNSSYYVFLHNDGYIEDYDELYNDPVSLIELIGTIIERETRDGVYATKMVRILAMRLGVFDKLREEYK